MKNQNFIPLGLFLLSCFWANAQTPIHDYELNNSYLDVFGGNNMIPNGGTLTPTSYDFDFGQGPNVSGVIDTFTYTIELKFTPSFVGGWRKIIDFDNRNWDVGLYIYEGSLLFYPTAGDTTNIVFNTDEPATVVLTRDEVNNEVRAYVNGIEQWMFIDDFNFYGTPTGFLNYYATFTGIDNIIQILIDDLITEGTESSIGTLDYFKIYDYALTPEQVSGMCSGIDSDCDGVNNDCDICPGGNDNGPCHATSLSPLFTLPPNWLCNNNNNSEKVKVCHDGATLCVSENAAATHLGHGDFLGPCVSCPQNFSGPEVHHNYITSPVLEMDLTPNPAKEEVYIQIPKSDGNTTIFIYDQLGRFVWHEELQPGITKSKIDVKDGWNNGVYIIQIKQKDEVFTKQIIIAR